MEQAFAAGDPPLGLSAEMHAAALGWVPPGFAAFDTGRVDDEADDAVTVEPEQGPMPPIRNRSPGRRPQAPPPTPKATATVMPHRSPVRRRR